MKMITKQQIASHWRQFVHDIKLLLAVKPNPETFVFAFLMIAGTLFSLSLAGALFGFVYAYKRLAHSPRGPVLMGQPSAIYASMIVWALLFPAVAWLAWHWFHKITDFDLMRTVMKYAVWLISNLLISMILMAYFRSWRNGIFNYQIESGRYGTASFADEKKLRTYSLDETGGGLYIGDFHFYNKRGHALSVADTRGGKGVNLIIPNLLEKMGSFTGSWVIIDPKGENAAVTARVMRERGRKVVIINPWDLLGLGSDTFNPLDILKLDRLNLSDDIQMIAEAIVPMTADGDTDHFNNRARTIIAGLLLHLVTSDAPDGEKNLATLWQWLRLDGEKWRALLSSMSKNSNPVASEIVQAVANEIVNLKEQSEREYGSVMSTAQKFTDFLKSPALRDNLTPGDDETRFKPSDLTDKLTVVYVVIPADRLFTHSQWLRLVTTSLMRSVIRQPQTAKIKPLDVCFLLDEAYALGYLSEIKVGLGSYAGYGVHIWAIYQNLVQIRDSYGNNWENFISSCGVRHFFNISDNTTADYVSKMMGTFSVPQYDALGKVSGSTGRSLVNPDELRQTSNDNIYTIIDTLPPAKFKKRPYYLEENLKVGQDYDQNPYHRG